jgi:hypothetical protein
MLTINGLATIYERIYESHYATSIPSIAIPLQYILTKIQPIATKKSGDAKTYP